MSTKNIIPAAFRLITILGEEENGPGPFCLEHIIFLIIGFILFAAGIYFLFVKMKDEKKRELALKIICLVHLVFILTNRISVTYGEVVLMPEKGYTWLRLLPNTFCGLFSLILPFFVFFGKKGNPVLYYLSLMGLVGGTLSVFYPEYLKTQIFWDIRSLTGLLHHLTMIFILTYCILIRRIDYSVRKWYIYPIGQACLILFGVFEIYVLKFPDAMNITKPLVGDNMITSWWSVSIAMFVLQFAISFVYEHFRNHKTYRELGLELIGKKKEE